MLELANVCLVLCAVSSLRGLWKQKNTVSTFRSWFFLVAQMVKNLPAMWESKGSIPGWGRSLGEGNGYPLQYSCLGNPKDRGVWWNTAYGVAKSWTRLSDQQWHTKFALYTFGFMSLAPSEDNSHSLWRGTSSKSGGGRRIQCPRECDFGLMTQWSQGRRPCDWWWGPQGRWK